MHRSDKEAPSSSFHIEDELYLDYQKVDADQLAPAWQHDTSIFCESLIHLREISIQSSHILANIRKKHPDIGSYLALLDKKIDILSQLAGNIALGGEIRPNHKVTLSAESMCFKSAEAMAIGSPLRLKVVLFPSHLCLHLQSRVVRCEESAGGYRLEVRFEQAGETEREALIRHLLEKQSAARRRERGN